ncbi:MAG: hypothetical protein AAF362_08185 [Pseudomonadota bacterium]
METALQGVLNSPEFSGAKRLSALLQYVVRESLEGRADLIRGKTIAQDVYDRGMDQDDRGLNLVKVDAGRLRRRLENYYENSGANDSVRIEIPQGGYAPIFTNAEQQNTGNHDQASTETWRGSLSSSVPLYALLGVVVLAIAVVYFLNSQGGGQKEASVDTSERETALRQAILAKSPTALQSLNLSTQARSLIFPPLDPKRLQSTLEMFERSIELDKNNFGGHAGAAQISAMQAILSPQGTRRQERINAAQTYADNALQLRPEDAWTQSALAWVAFAKRNFDEANEVSQRAVAIAPDDYDVLDFDALIALFTGQFERAVESSSPERHKDRTGSRFVYRNIYAVSNYYLDNYDETIDFLEQAAEMGDPVSQLSIIYQAAAHQMAGNESEAEKLVEDFKQSWPDGRPDILLMWVFSDKSYADQVMEPFKAAGWSPKQTEEEPSDQIR